MYRLLLICGFLTHVVTLSSCAGSKAFSPEDCAVLAAIATDLAISIEIDTMTDDQRAAMAQRYTVIGGELAAAGCKQFVPVPDLE